MKVFVEEKVFVKELVTNRFGIVMATLNLCYFLSSQLSYNLFSDKVQNITFYRTGNIFHCLNFYFPEIMLHINSPAALISRCSTFLLVMDSKIPKITEVKLFFVFFLFFLVLQWLFIGWSAKKIAGKISESV